MRQMQPSQSIDKIASGALRELVSGAGSDDRSSVIVEAAGGPVIAELPRIGESGRPAGKVAFSQPAEHEHVLEALGQRLHKLTGQRPKLLKYAEAYVVNDATAEQLREIAAWPETGTIRPNRVHRTRNSL